MSGPADMRSMSPVQHMDFLPQMKAIGQTLKKRFFRKPNVTEAVEQYDQLCKELQRDGQDEFAAVCALEAAKCHESLQNQMEYANRLVKAGKFFLDARAAELQFPGAECSINLTAQTHLQMAMQHLGKAVEVYRAQQSHGLALTISVLMGQKLFEAKEYGESLKWYQTALDIASSNFTLADQIVILESVVACKVKSMELERAAKLVGDYLLKMGKAEGSLSEELFLQYTMKFETIRVCLLLILGTNSMNLAKFIWSDSSEENMTFRQSNERQEVLICLKSLVLAVEHSSVDEITRVRDYLSYRLSQTELELFSILIKSYS